MSEYVECIDTGGNKKITKGKIYEIIEELPSKGGIEIINDSQVKCFYFTQHFKQVINENENKDLIDDEVNNPENEMLEAIGRKAYNQKKEMLEIIDEQCKMMSDTLKSKNTDYGNSFERTLNKYGDVALMLRLEDKFNRLESLFANKYGLVKDEGFEDTLRDLAGYCLLYLSVKNRG